MTGLFPILQPILGATRARRICMLLAPLTSLFTTPWQLVRTLRNCLSLLGGRTGDTNRFSVHNGINSLYYLRVAHAMRTHGRNGSCPTLGLGNYPLRTNFQYSLPSLYAYAGAPNMTVLLGMLAWLFSHMMYGDLYGWGWVSLVTLLAGISTTFYANTFVLQHYNALAWAFFPLGLFGLTTQQWGLASIAWLAVSLGSPNVAVLAYPLSLIQAIAVGSLTPLLALIPVTIKLLLHLWPMVQSGKPGNAFKPILDLLGARKGKGRYQMSTHRQLSKRNIYHLCLYLLFLSAMYFITGTVGLFTITALALFVLNRTLCRFADDQILHMLLLSTATMETLTSGQLWLLPFYWLAASPLARTANFQSIRGVLDTVPELKPFDVRPPLKEMEAFLAPVQTGERILMAFEDPNNLFSNIFDGFRVLTELPCYIAQRKGVHCFPDWWAVTETNIEDAPPIWGRDITSATSNAAYWKADYLLIYQVNEMSLDTMWEQMGYTQVSYFFWGDRKWIPHGREPWNGPAPHWFLLKTPDNKQANGR